VQPTSRASPLGLLSSSVERRRRMTSQSTARLDAPDNRTDRLYMAETLAGRP